jgi:hypothetical protein
MCLDGAGFYDISMVQPHCFKIPDFPNGVLTIDTTNVKNITMEPTHYRIFGELRFDTMEQSDMADEIGLRIADNLVYTDLDLDDIEWEANWKMYSIWIERHIVEENDF